MSTISHNNVVLFLIFWKSITTKNLFNASSVRRLFCLFSVHLFSSSSVSHGALQCRPAYFLLHFVDSQRRCRGESDWRRHSRLLRQRLEPHHGRSGTGPLPSNRPDQRRTHLQVTALKWFYMSNTCIQMLCNSERRTSRKWQNLFKLFWHMVLFKTAVPLSFWPLTFD